VNYPPREDAVRGEEALAPLEMVMRYHEETKHHFSRYARALGYMDWANQPDPFRRYEGSPLSALPLLKPDDAPLSPLYEDLYRDSATITVPVDVRSLSRFLEYSLAISAWKQAGELRWALRTNPSSGNLHPTEGYLLMGRVPGLSTFPGLYHYAAREHALELRAEWPQESFDSLMQAFPPRAFLVGFTSVNWREAWKYGERGFRYCQHDVGHAIGTMPNAKRRKTRIARRVLGINRVLWGGVFLYVKEARNPETLERYGHGTPDDWLERNIYSKFQVVGLTLMGATDVVLFGLVPGILIFMTQIVWIPFWAAGVINGIGHYWGYRHWSTPDASTNIVPLGLLIGGEELHNNHHAYPTSAKLSMKWYEFDIGWLYIQLLEAAGMARVKHVAPVPRLGVAKPVVDPQTLQAIIACRYAVLAQYGRTLRRAYREELVKLRRFAPHDAVALKIVEPWLDRDERLLRENERARLAELLPKSRVLQTMVAMRHELAAVWGRSMATREQLVAQLQDWCRRAETSEIKPLAEFSQQLRCYA